MSDFYTVVVTVSEKDGYHEAVAQVGWQVLDTDAWGDVVTITRKLTTVLCSSRDRARAISYALTEAALAFERGEVT